MGLISGAFSLSLVFLLLNLPGFANGKRSVCQTDVCQNIAQRLSEGIDPQIDPCDDFYEFACGNWVKKNKIPDDRSWWSPWSISRVRLRRHVRNVLEDPASNRLESVTKAKNLYRGCMDMSARQGVGLEPLKRLLNKIGGWPIIDKNWQEDSYNWIPAYVFLRSRLGLNYIINMYVDIDSKNTSQRVIYLDRPSLGLGRSELQNPRDSLESRRLVHGYKTYIRSSARMLNVDAVTSSLMVKDVNDMIRFEQRLAFASSPLEDRRNHFALYNKMTIGQLQQQFPGINWLSLIRRVFKYARVPITEQDEVVVQDVAYYKNLPSILRTTPNRILANYIGWRFISRYADFTTQEFVNAYFEFQKVAQGQKKPEKQWEICYNIVDSYFPYTIGRLYVDSAFNGKSKREIEMLVASVKSAFRKELDRYDWMDTFTRKRAKEKLDEMLVSVAYQPFLMNDTLLESNYRGMKEIDESRFFSAILNLDRWMEVNDMRKLRKPVKRDDSKLSGPAMINAFNYFDLNYIQFPAGILTQPFFNYGGPASINFGAIGKTIGHEIIHGFDDEGKQYDKNGNLRDWWSMKTQREYNRRSQCFIREYDNFREPSTGLLLSGVDTQGENLADNGGLRMAFKAYKNYLLKFGEEKDPLLPGSMQKFTSEQLFFLSFASIWCENERRESLRNTIKYGVHSPTRFRVIGTVMNSKEFSKAFTCSPGSQMNPNKKCLLW